MAKTWANFWAQQSDPRHPRDADFYAIHSAELQLIVGSCAGKRVLELGCGSGELFDHLHFGEATTYRGVDFSQQMLAKFAERHPEVITARRRHHRAPIGNQPRQHLPRKILNNGIGKYDIVALFVSIG